MFNVDKLNIIGGNIIFLQWANVLLKLVTPVLYLNKSTGIVAMDPQL